MNKYYKVTFEMNNAWAVDVSTVVSAKTKNEAITIVKNKYPTSFNHQVVQVRNNAV